ncbi:type VII secretion protein EccE [Krasilnikovia sp. MM14-A1259]|uniref:type VII secretion protein EccE n=1 Tax=Krasilnikovia sp. MM14-A1259 TaxID=3373539 RepID=UPI00380BC9FF
MTAPYGRHSQESQAGAQAQYGSQGDAGRARDHQTAAQQPAVWGQQQTQGFASIPSQSRAYASAAAAGQGSAAAATYAASSAQMSPAASAAPAAYDFSRAAAAAAPPPPPVVTAPGHPRPVRTGSGALGIGQVLVWQVAAAAVLAAYHDGDMVVMAAVAAVAVALVAPTIVRFRGRWLHRWFGVWLRYRGRPRTAAVTGGAAALDLLIHAESSVAVTTMELDGHEAALLTHRGGLCAVLALGPDDNVLLGGEPVTLPSPVTLLPGAEAHAIPTTAQLLVSLRPAPVVGPGVVERAYRELTGGDVPAQRRSWLVLQATRTADAYADADLQPALISAVRRARRHLRMDQVEARVLDRDALGSAIGHLGGLSEVVRSAAGRRGGRASASGDPARPTSREAWRSLAIDATAQSCHRVVRWPAGAWRPEDLLGKASAVGSVLSLAVAHGPAQAAAGDDVRIEVAFRLIAPDPATLAAGERVLEDAVRAAHGRTERLDGEQVDGLAATLPFGGFLL